MAIKPLLLVLFLFVTGISLAAIYKWVDDEGVIHYSETPPPGGKAEEIKRAPTPSEKEIQRSRDRLEKLLEQQRQSNVLRRRSEEKNRQERAAKRYEEAVRKERCILARQHLHMLEIKQRVYTLNKKGERVYLVDEARSAAIEHAKMEIEKYCN